MRHLLILLISVMCMSFSGIVELPTDKANHFVVGACISKVINAYVPDQGDAFLWKSAIFIGKELFDNRKANPTGFSLDDLAYDYLGDIIVTWELKF